MTVTLNGSNPDDSDDGIKAFLWEQVGTSNPVAFTAPTVAAGTTETLSFELTVTDAGQLQATDTCDVKVNGEELPPVVEPPAEEPPVVEPPPVEEPPVVQPPVDDNDDHHGEVDDDDHDEGEHSSHDRSHHKKHSKREYRHYENYGQYSGRD